MVLSNSIFGCRQDSEVSDLPLRHKIIEDFIAPSELKKQNSPHLPSLQNPTEELSVIGECSSRRQFFDALVKNLAVQDLPGREHVINYLRLLYRRNCRPGTLVASKLALQTFLVFIKQLGKSCVEEITRQDLEAFIEHEQDRGLKPNSVRTRLVRLNAWLGFLIEGEIIGPEILTRRIRIKLPELLPKAIDPEDIKKLLSALDHVRDRAMFLMLLRTGMRIGELLQTTVKDINMKERKVMIMEAQKTCVGRVVYFSDDAKEALNAWLQQRDSDKILLFYGQGRNSLCYTAARVKFKKYLSKAGLSHQGYTLHCLRHTFASELLNAGMRLECLQQLLGHTNLEVTRRYARLTDNTREQEYFKAMSRIERGEIDGHYRFHRELPTVC
jgi:integrase/recombinase XerD